MNELKAFFAARQVVFDYFGYVEDWVTIPLDDATEYFWHYDENTKCVGYAATEQELRDQDGRYYVNELYTQRFLPKWIYEGKEYTMICVDTRTDGNKYLQVFDNSKRIDVEKTIESGVMMAVKALGES